MKNRFGAEARNYKFGNPLIGMSLNDIPHYFNSKKQLGLFNKNPLDFVNVFRDAYKRYFSLSDKIKEDLQVREQLEVFLRRCATRIGDAMDLITSTYFSKIIDSVKINDVLSNLDSDDFTWSNLSISGLVPGGQDGWEKKWLLSSGT